MTTLRLPDNRSRLDIPLCGICKKPFFKKSTLHTICSPKCALAIPAAESKRQKAEAKKDRQRREALKSRSDWMKEAQAAVNRYARLRDIRSGYGCTTCQQPYTGRFGGAFDAGHMHSRGSRPELKFHLHNIALQCVKDNRYLGGLALEFRQAMVARHGAEKIDAMESIRGPAKHSVEYLKRLKRVFAKKANRLQKRIDDGQD